MTHSAHLAALGSIAIVLASACSAPEPAGPGEMVAVQSNAAASAQTSKIAICHIADAFAREIEIAPSARSEHQGHGDYPTQLFVHRPASHVGDGIHFSRITDALNAARAQRIASGEVFEADCRITISVSEGVFAGALGERGDPTLEKFPLIIDVPDITLSGATRLMIDANKRATAVATDGVETVIHSEHGLEGLPLLIVNSHPGETSGNGAHIEGFVLDNPLYEGGAPPNGVGIFSMRTTGVQISNNRFSRGFTAQVDMRASSAALLHNSLTGGSSCDMCLAGPGTFHVEGNTLFNGGLVGILVTPAVMLPVPPMVAWFTPDEFSEVAAVIVNNEVRDYTRVPYAAALRVAAIGPAASIGHGLTQVEVRNNSVVNNMFGLIVDAGFPVNDESVNASVALSTRGNDFRGNCQTNFLVAFNRHATAIGLQPGPYMSNSTYTFSLGGDLAWRDAWFAHAAGHGNELVVDGNVILNGTVQAYDGDKPCS